MKNKPRVDRETADVLARSTSLLAETHRQKRAIARVKKAPTDGSGRFSAVVSTFGPPPDSQGDVISPGAFLLSIIDWQRRGRQPSVWWSHAYESPAAAIGVVEKMWETDEGLNIQARLDLDHDPALAVYEGLLAGRLSEFSIGYAVIKEHEEFDPAYGHFAVLDEVELLEVSVVAAGANRFTHLVDVKSTSTTSLADRLVEVFRESGITAPDRLQRVRWSVEDLQDRPDLLLGDLNFLIDGWTVPEPDPTLKQLNAQIDDLERPTRKTSDSALSEQVDDFVAALQQEMVEEKLAEARAARLDAELDASAAHVGPVPEFDERFVVRSVPTEHEPGDTDRLQVVGYQSETFRIAVLPGTMRPDDE